MSDFFCVMIVSLFCVDANRAGPTKASSVCQFSHFNCNDSKLSNQQRHSNTSNCDVVALDNDVNNGNNVQRVGIRSRFLGTTPHQNVVQSCSEITLLWYYTNKVQIELNRIGPWQTVEDILVFSPQFLLTNCSSKETGNTLHLTTFSPHINHTYGQSSIENENKRPVEK